MFISGGICDRCGRVQYGIAIMSKKIVVKKLRNDGWTIGKDQMLCPTCNGSQLIYTKTKKMEVSK